MKQLIFIFSLSIFIYSAKAQDVTLLVHQQAPLQITAGLTVLNMLQGDDLVLGNDVILSGGTSPYQTTWSSSGWGEDSISNTITVAPDDTTIYTLKVIDANNCTQEQAFQVNVIYPIQINIIINQISCYGMRDGAIIMNITGGASPYSIKWADGPTAMVRINLGSGSYSVKITDAMGQQKDTLVTLNEFSQIHTSLNASVCEGDTYLFNGMELTETGAYSRTFQSVHGCDSVVTLNLTVNPNLVENINAAICKGEAYLFSGSLLTDSGQYQDSLTTIAGCDSIVILNLTVNPVSTQTINAAICEGDTYYFSRSFLTESGQYSDSLKNVSGCDSIIILDLTVNPSYNQTIDVVICQNEIFTFAGNRLTQSGLYQDVSKTVSGCDSITTLNLTVNPTFIQTNEAVICQGETYLFEGNLLNEAGIYIDSLKTVEGCDSITILNLTVNPTFINFIDAIICQDETYLFAGNQLSEGGQYQDSLKTLSGCDSIVVLNLTVNPLPEIPVITQNKNTLTSSSNESTQWYKSGAEIPGGINQALNITESGDYAVIVTNSAGCRTQSLIYNAVYTSVPAIYTADIICAIFPNPNNGLFTVEIEIEKPEVMVLKLISVDGKVVAEKQLQDVSLKQSVLFGKENLAKGVYTLQVRFGTKIINRKLIVN